MQHEKSFGYTLILGVCVLISLMLIGRMLLYQPLPVHTPYTGQISSQEQGKTMTYLSEQDVSKYLSEKLPEEVPLKDLQITLQKEGIVTAKGSLHKNVLLQFGVPQAVLLWMPEQIELSIRFTALSDGAALRLTPSELKIGDVTVPVGHIPPEWLSMLNETVNEMLRQAAESYSQIELLDGGIQLRA